MAGHGSCPIRMSAPLPIFELRQTFTAALLDPALPNLLIKAPTGSGKSTQIPQFVLDSGFLAKLLQANDQP